MYVCTYHCICMYVYIHIYTLVYIYLFLYVCKYSHQYVCMYLDRTRVRSEKVRMCIHMRFSLCHVTLVVFQCVAVCCSVLQYVAVCYSVLQCVAVCCGVYLGRTRMHYEKAHAHICIHLCKRAL